MFTFKFFHCSQPSEKISSKPNRSKEKMDLKFYTVLIAAVCFAPPVLTFIIGAMFWWCCRKGESLMLILMKSVIVKRNIDKRPAYLICDRKLPSSSKKYFVIYSLLILTICVQCFFMLSFFELSFKCIDDPDLDCFKEKIEVNFNIADIKLSTFDNSPVNCSSISPKENVFCYRITAFDPEKAFFSAAASYLLFELINIALIFIAHVMLFLAGKCKSMVMVKLFLVLFFSAIFAGIFVLRTQVDEFHSATRKLSYTVIVQGLLVLFFVFFYVVLIPWGRFEKEEYYGDASLPGNIGSHTNEMHDLSDLK